MKGVICGLLVIVIFMVVVGAILYGCTVNILQTTAHGSAKDVGELTSKDMADINAKLMLP